MIEDEYEFLPGDRVTHALSGSPGILLPPDPRQSPDLWKVECVGKATFWFETNLIPESPIERLARTLEGS